MGGWSSAGDVGLLKKLGVTGIVNCTLPFEVAEADKNSFEYLRIQISDDEMTTISKHFDSVLAFVKKHHDKGNAVLIHCAPPLLVLVRFLFVC